MSFNTGIIFNKKRTAKIRHYQVTIVKTYLVDVDCYTRQSAEEQALLRLEGREKDFHTETDVVNICQRKD